MYYTKVSLKDQAKILRKHFGITVSIARPPKLDERAEHQFLIPSWKKIGKTYNEAVEKVLNKIKETRPFYNWREGEISSEYLRVSSKKGVIPEIINAQFGESHKGESVDTVRKTSELLLGAYEVGIMLLTHPDRLAKYEDLWIDCPGDEYFYEADGDFSFAPSFRWDDGKLGFVTYWAGDANDRFGAVSAFGS